MVFFSAAKFEDVEGEGNLNLVVGLAKLILDVSGVFGFVIVMMLIAKINHFLNTSTSGGWTTSWLVINGLIPFTIVILDWGGKLVGNFTDGVPDTPMWLDWYYPLILLPGNHHTLQKLIPVRNHRQESSHQEEVLVF